MSEQNGASSEEGKRFVVSRLVVGTDGANLRIPLMAFDTIEGAQEFAQNEAEWLNGIPQQLKDGLLGRLGIVQIGMAVTGLRTPDGVRRIEIAPAGAMPKILLKS